MLFFTEQNTTKQKLVDRSTKQINICDGVEINFIFYARMSFNYDVFLNFRGTDARYGFTRNLYQALCNQGIHTFIDDEELQRGNEITPSLLEAIEESILVCPIFYHGDISDVKKQTGSYGEALALHEERFDDLLYEKNRVDEEVKRRLGQYIKNTHFDCARNKPELPFWLDVEEISSSSLYLHSLLNDFQGASGECPPNHFTTFPVKKDKQKSITGNILTQIDNNELRWSNRDVPRDPEFQHGYTYKYNQHVRKEIVRSISSFIVSTIVFLGIFYNIWNSQLPIMNVPALNKERDGSIWPSLLGLFGFMMFVCAVSVMILVGAAFTSMQKAMLIFWVIFMHLQSANSNIEVFLTLLGGLFMGWFAFGKKQPQNEVS
ncbi:hypothetical protein P8452_60673 [Trifolium repens]|nr:hypothetical protein P8452_60673 [Trifolium repens]